MGSILVLGALVVSGEAMTQSLFSRSAISLALIIILNCLFAGAQSLAGNTATMNYATPGASTTEASSLVPYAELRQLELIGMYRADGSFRTVWNGARVAPLQGTQMEFPDQMEVPASIHLISNEGVVENLVPPARASQPARGHSLLAVLRDNIITFAYGRERVLQTPTHLITDSRGRLIVSDPQLGAVHVLDASGKRSFRILGGPMRRLQSPGALALDAEDNIYVADVKLGLISVYDPEGKFLRYIGSVQGESMFDAPTGIAIDRKTKRLYVLDATANELIVLDLQGNVLKRVGTERSHSDVRLRYPSEIAIWKNEVVVLDHYGSRIQILDLDCNPIRSFAVRDEHGPPILGEVGMAIDGRSRIYLGNLLSSSVRVYSQNGEFLGFLGRSPVGQRFNLPLGLWVDSTDRLYVSDSNNSRVQVFQIPTPDAALPAAR